MNIITNQIKLASILLGAVVLLFSAPSWSLGMPDSDPTSGKFINVTRGLSSLGDTGAINVFNVSVEVPASEPTLFLEVFDGNMAGLWDRTPGVNFDTNTFKLFPDPTLIGNSTTDEVALLVSDSELMADNGWTTIYNGGHSAAAYNATRDSYIYHLLIQWATTDYTDEQNNFKINTNDSAFLLAGSTIGFVGFGPTAFGNTLATTYDGKFTFFAIIPDGLFCELDIYDGDADRRLDDDDTNSPDLPPFPTSVATIDQDVNNGNPPDDFIGVPVLQVAPDVFYRVRDASGNVVGTNNNPSGDKEWELFRVQSTDPACAGVISPGVPDATVASFGAGLFPMEFEGVDAANTVFFNVNVEVVPGVPEEEECAECDGEVSTLTLQNNGDATDVQVFQKNVSDPIFDGPVAAGGTFVVNPALGEGTLGTEISIITADGECAVGSGGKGSKGKGSKGKGSKGKGSKGKGSKGKGSKGKGSSSNCNFHTSCSKPIGPGSVSGPFEVISGESLDGGLLCPVMQGGDFACAKPLDALTMIWDGSQEVGVRAWKDEPGEILLHTQDNILPGDEVEVTGYAPKDGNDVIWEIYDTDTSGSKLGESVYHMSCSDDDMDGAEDCGKREGDGKNNGGGFINDWLLEGMVDAEGVLNCTP